VTIDPTKFQRKVLTWFKINGRKNLPWQQTRSSYSTWVSEIMLQQTQVATVIPYFNRFIQRFPSFGALAQAELDEVLSLWSGLGYYARARNLHRCAQIVLQEHGGEFPRDQAILQTLPGIGRSTAGAILALGFNHFATILDGNVKRLLARFHAIQGWPGLSSVNQQLWTFAEYYTPASKEIAHYTQAMMDLGALICTPKHAKCGQCPLQTHCLAHTTAHPEHFPSPRPSKKLPRRSINLLILVNRHAEVFLEKRPPTGIWGGLWSLPECPISENAQHYAQKYYHCEIEKLYPQNPVLHTFSHFLLEIHPIIMPVKKWSPPLMETNHRIWYNLGQLKEKGLAAPIKRILNTIN
jgi:A/G-specific adenine glycosylase